MYRYLVIFPSEEQRQHFCLEVRKFQHCEVQPLRTLHRAIFMRCVQFSPILESLIVDYEGRALLGDASKAL